MLKNITQYLIAFLARAFIGTSSLSSDDDQKLLLNIRPIEFQDIPDEIVRTIIAPNAGTKTCVILFTSCQRFSKLLKNDETVWNDILNQIPGSDILRQTEGHLSKHPKVLFKDFKNP